MEGLDKEQFSKKRKITRNLLNLIMVVLVVGTFFIFIQKSGWRLNWFLEKISYQKYEHIGPNFSFRYPDYFQLDVDEQKKFGDKYIAGIRLKTDQRTGCDLRYNSVGIDFQKTDQEIRNAISAELSQGAKEYELVSSERIKLDGEDAFLAEFTFLDPTGSVVRLSQIITSHAGANFILICGTGDYQYRYFQKDFQDFLDSFEWRM